MIFSHVFDGSGLVGYNKTTIDKTRKELHILQENKQLQSRHIHNEFVLINLTRIELGDQQSLLHTLHLTLLQ